MTSDERSFPVRVADARAALVALLRSEWPEPRDVRPRDLSIACEDADFLAAAMTLQEEGCIMFEAILIGTAPHPKLLDCALTRKGQTSRIG